ncbi:hypothetical protein GHT07_03395 [Caenimonas koreensis DSM 17982]|uniref:Uncharacterized protein n=1 Tax=Caenimonas koreensis DSM 17982 TaxID=1121255 RepID=A0A844AVA0_9BURK|nr:hypothetical protein [Caenimonas koreensis]MRD46308.1 hypothetical protein [Caenimonas koreensis DSM 17982]
MSGIRQFVEIREDGRLKPETMTVDEFVAQGVSPKRVVQARWEFDGRTVLIANRFGMHAQVLPERDGVVALYDHGNNPPTCELRVVNGDGSLRMVINNRVHINGSDCPGIFSWFSPPLLSAPGAFGAIFSADSGSMWHLDIDANDGRVLAARQSK